MGDISKKQVNISKEQVTKEKAIKEADYVVHRRRNAYSEQHIHRYYPAEIQLWEALKKQGDHWFQNFPAIVLTV